MRALTTSLLAVMLISAAIVVGFACALAGAAVIGATIILGVALGGGLACIAE